MTFSDLSPADQVKLKHVAGLICQACNLLDELFNNNPDLAKDTDLEDQKLGIEEAEGFLDEFCGIV